MMKKTIKKKRKGQRRPSDVRKRISQMITWMGLVVIGVLAVPTGVLITLISMLWSVTDKIAVWIQDG